MGQLKQSKTGYNMYLGWYGKCGETDCDQSFDLTSTPEIGVVYKFTGGSYDSYNQGTEDYMKGFTELECGNAYWIALKPNPQEKQGLEESFAKADSARDFILEKKWLIAMNELHKK